MGRAIVLSSNKVAVLISTAILAGYLLGRWSARNSSSTSDVAIRGTNSNRSSNNNDNKGAFVLLVNMKFTTLAHRDTFLEWVEPVCKDVLVHEGLLPSTPASLSTSLSTSTQNIITTLSYQVAISDKDPLLIVVMERYSDKEHGYLEVHRSGSEFLKFRERLKGMQEDGDVVIEGESYFETELGYI